MKFEQIPTDAPDLKRKRKPHLITAALVGMLITGAVASQAVPLPDQQAVEALVNPGPASFAGLVRTVKPAVVNISISGRAQTSQGFRGNPFGRSPGQPNQPNGSPFDEFFQEHFGGQPQMRGGRREAPEFRAVGSGFIISAAGQVVTNNHVIEHAEKIDVVLQDGTRYSATVQGRDPKTDLALLQIDGDVELPFVTLGSSEDAEVGDWVLAVGNPFGLGGSVTAGIISARGRDIQAGPFDDFLQIDAPINRGNSGGPLFDAQGRVIGINTAIYSPSGGSVGIGFAIPSEMAGDIIDQLRATGVVERGWLGVEFQSVTEAVAASLGLDEPHGALVAGVVEDGPADRAGMKLGDVIVSLNGEKLEEPKDLPRLVANTKAGTRVELEVLRGGKTRTLDVKIGRTEPDADLAATGHPQSNPAQLGVQLAELTPEARQRYGVQQDSGVLVTDVQRGSPAAKAGIRPGQIITMVGQTPVNSPGEVVAEVARAQDDGRPSVLFMLQHRGGRQFVAVDLAA